MRQAQLERPFYVGLKELTNEEYLAFDAQHDSGVIERNTLSLKNQPVVHVSWNQAASFCNWLSAQEGLPAAYTEVNGEMVAVSPMNTGFRLPSEAEWAYVARYGGHSEGRAALRYPWGGNMPPAAGSGNYAGAEAATLMERSLRSYQDQNPATSPVGEHPPGPLGLYDIGGNVREWMHDYYVIHTAGLGANPVDTLGPEKGTNHVIRGSGWRSASITELRLAYRDDGLEGLDDVGIRLARYAE
jgi:formylglycine-generating enzyme required for sulfatase activity